MWLLRDIGWLLSVTCSEWPGKQEARTSSNWEAQRELSSSSFSPSSRKERVSECDEVGLTIWCLGHQASVGIWGQGSCRRQCSWVSCYMAIYIFFPSIKITDTIFPSLSASSLYLYHHHMRRTLLTVSLCLCFLTYKMRMIPWRNVTVTGKECWQRT